jgi:glycosyltransferase involved in cell wall biosynthesis
MPHVSIVIRTKNEEASLPLCLEEITKQSYQDFEIIVIDSGSTDKTVEIALNKGIRSSQGKIIVAISAHCLPVNNVWLEYLVASFNTHEKLAGVFGRQIPFESAAPYEKRGLKQSYPSEEEFFLIDSPHFSNANGAFLREAWEIYPFDEKLSFCEDVKWCSVVQKKGFKIGYEPRSVVYHSHRESLKDVFYKYYIKNKALKELSNITNFKIHGIAGYLLRWIKSVILDYVLLLKRPVNTAYFIYWIFFIPLFRVAVYAGHYKASKK